MKVVRSLLLVAVLASSFVVMAASEALACSCIPPQPDRKAIKDADAVFTGTLAATEPGVEVGFDDVTWTFAVDTVYKGDVSQSQDVTSETQDAACGLIFEEGTRYAVFAYEGEGTASPPGLNTNSCMNTRELRDDQELKLKPVADFGEAQPRVPPDDEGVTVEPVVVVVIALVAVVGLVTAALLRKRRA